MAVHPQICYKSLTLAKSLVPTEDGHWFYYEGSKLPSLSFDNHGSSDRDAEEVMRNIGKDSYYEWAYSDEEFIRGFFAELIASLCLRGVVDRWIYPAISMFQQRPERFLVGTTDATFDNKSFSNLGTDRQICVNAETRQVFFQGVSRSLPQFEALAQWVREYDHKNHPFGPWELITERI